MEHETDPQPSLEGKAKDEDRLAELGYKQELTRNWSLLHNFGVSFSIIVRRVTISSFDEVYIHHTVPSFCPRVQETTEDGNLGNLIKICRSRCYFDLWPVKSINKLTSI